MNVIFLDNDGVICLANNWGSRRKKQEKWGGLKLSMTMHEIPLEYRFDNFDPKAVIVLNEILEETNAEIVVSSDWRLYATLEELGDYYESQGIIKRPIGVTDVFHFTNWRDEGFVPNDEDFPWSRNDYREQERHFEIMRYLGNYPSIKNWVAIDDLNMGININTSWGACEREWGLSNFVWTPRDWEGIKQSGIKDKVLKFLKKDENKF
jgi:hypothetical protein